MDENIKILTDKELETSFADEAYKMYIREISHYPTLSVDEQKELGRRYRENGDLDAKETLINCNLRLVVSVARHYKLRLKHLQILDVIQEGNLGLLRAVESYDPEQGAFSNYAICWIRQKITLGLANKDEEIRKSKNFLHAKFKYARLIESYEKNGLPIPSDEEICDILGISKETLKSIRDAINKPPFSMNQFFVGNNKAKSTEANERSELESYISSETHDYDDLLNKMVDNDLLLVLKEILSPLYYFVIYHRILSENQKTFKEISTYFNVTYERVRQIVASASKKIKPYMENSNEYAIVLNRIKQREKGKFYLLKTTPLSPIQIIKYMYLKDDLTDLERKLYELYLLGRHNYRACDYISILGISLNELNQVMASLKVKIGRKFSDKRSFKIFRETMIKTYGSSIYSIDLSEKEKIEDYRVSEENYSLSLELRPV